MNEKQAQHVREITTKIKGNGNWYWIPNEILAEFKSDLRQIRGLMYLDNPRMFEYFVEKYNKYRTFGHKDNMPDFFNAQEEYSNNEIGAWYK